MNNDKKILEQDVINSFILQSIQENRSSKKWSFFLKLVFLIFIFAFFFITISYFKNSNFKNSEHVGVIYINGLISDNRSSSSRNIIDLIDSAFYNNNCKAIILRINSPGGTPVQSNIIHDYIKEKRSLNIKPIYSVIEDMGTSGAYLIAIATEKIYCDPSSIVGSISASINTFGVVDILDKLGIERRLYKSGKHKSILNPFAERNQEDDEVILHNLNLVHNNFVSSVKKDRPFIKLDEDELFSGKFWIGREALEFGLVDGFYNVYSLSKDIIKLHNLVEYKHEIFFLNNLIR